MRLGRHAPPREEPEKEAVKDAELRDAMEALAGEGA
jgi:hypothetical protein